MSFYLTESSGRHVTGNDASATSTTRGPSPAEVPPGVQQPVAMLQGPQEAAAQSCDGTEVTAALSSTGHLGRPFESYVWTAVAADTLGDNAMLAAEARALDTPVFDLTGDDLSVVGAYVDVTVLVETGSEPQMTSDRFRIRVTAGLPPSVEIMGGIAQTYRRMDPVSVMAQGIATACDGRGLIKRAVNYTWALTPGGLESTSHDERFYKLPPYALDVGPLHPDRRGHGQRYRRRIDGDDRAHGRARGHYGGNYGWRHSTSDGGYDHPRRVGEPRPRRAPRRTERPRL